MEDFGRLGYINIYILYIYIILYMLFWKKIGYINCIYIYIMLFSWFNPVTLKVPYMALSGPVPRSETACLSLKIPDHWMRS